jgi:hypothetical protein
MAENWKPVLGYEGLYEVSDLGSVRSLARMVPCFYGALRPVRARILAQCGAGPYFTVNLSKDGVATTFTVHVLVAIVFVANPDNLSQVNHKDTNKRNCAATNLEWTDHAGNTAHAVANDLVCYGSEIHNAKLTKNDVLDIRRRRAQGQTLTEIHRAYPKVCRMTISNVYRRLVWRRVA